MSVFWTSFLANFLSNILAVDFLSVVGYEFRARIAGFAKRIINPQSLELAFPEGETREVKPGENNNYDVTLNLNIFYFSRSPFIGKKILHIYFPKNARHMSGDLQLVDSLETHNHFRMRLDDEILPGQSHLHQPYNIFRFEKYKGDKKSLTYTIICILRKAIFPTT